MIAFGDQESEKMRRRIWGIQTQADFEEFVKSLLSGELIFVLDQYNAILPDAQNQAKVQPVLAMFDSVCDFVCCPLLYSS
jgi:hypothetical protein